MEAIERLTENTAFFVGLCLGMIALSRLYKYRLGYNKKASLISSIGWFAMSFAYFLVQWDRDFLPVQFRVFMAILIVTEFYAFYTWWSVFRDVITASGEHGKQ